MTDASIDQVIETLCALAARPSIRQDKTVRQHLRQASALLAFPEEGLADHPLVKPMVEAQEWLAWKNSELESEVKFLQARISVQAQTLQKIECDERRIAELERELAVVRSKSVMDLLQQAQRFAFSRPTANTEPLAILGLQQGANASDIRKRHRELMQIHHPDRGGRTEVMGRINAARDKALEQLPCR